MSAIRSTFRFAQIALKKPRLLQNVSCIQWNIVRNHHDMKKYSKEHEWIHVEGDVGKVGISEYAKEKLGDIVYVQLPEVDAEVERDEECGAIESVKAASDLYTPVSGVIVEVNGAVEENCDIVNKSPEEEGWIFKIRLTNQEEDLNALMDKEAYDAFIKDEE